METTDETTTQTEEMTAVVEAQAAPVAEAGGSRTPYGCCDHSLGTVYHPNGTWQWAGH